MRFEDFRSNQIVVQTLKAAAGGRRLSHAYLLYGPPGTGKRTLARIFAQSLLCTGGDKPCGGCSHCVKFSRETHPDFTVLRKLPDKSFILIEQIRALREAVFLRPNEAERRVALIENADQMNLPAANALLKVLEEPPPYAVFLLTAESRKQLPETIASRCVCLEVHGVPAEDAREWLSKNFPGNSPAELQEAAAYGGGSLGRSRAYLEDEAVRRGYERAVALAKALADGREFDVVTALAPFEGDKSGFLRLLDDFENVLGRVAALPFSDGNQEPELSAVAARLGPLRAAKMHQLIGDARRRLFFNAGCALTTALFGALLKEI